VEPFPAGAILPVRKEHEGLLQGAVEMIYSPDGWMDAFFKASYLFSQWVNGPTGTQLMLWDYAGGGRELSKEMLKGLEIEFIAPLTVHPAEVWCHSKKAINSLADIKGLKIRVGSSVLAEIYKLLGAAPVVLSGAEVYESMKRGVIDAFEYVTPSVNWSMAFQEVSDYVYISPVRAPADRQSVFINKAFYNKLSPDLQMLLVTTAEALVPRFYSESIVLDAAALEKFIAYGNKVLPVPADVDAELGKVADKFFDTEAAKDPFFKKVIESQRAFKKFCEQSNVR